MYVYFIRAGYTGPIKIGVASNVQRRPATLQTGNHLPLYVIATIKYSSRAEAYEKENRFHKLFSNKRLGGEWFSNKIKLSEIDDEMNKLRKKSETRMIDERLDELLLEGCPI